MYSFTFNERPASNALDKLLETISPFPNYCIPQTSLFPIYQTVTRKLSSASSVREACPHQNRRIFGKVPKGGGGALFPIQVVSSYISSTPNTFVKILNFLEQIWNPCHLSSSVETLLLESVHFPLDLTIVVSSYNKLCLYYLTSDEILMKFTHCCVIERVLGCISWTVFSNVGFSFQLKSLWQQWEKKVYFYLQSKSPSSQSESTSVERSGSSIGSVE